MALSLNIDTIIQSNDSDTLRLIDGSGSYDAVTKPGGWLPEASSVPTTQPKTSMVNGSTIHLYLDVTIINSDSTEITYDQIELYDVSGPFATVNNLVFDITPNLLVSHGTALGEAGSSFPDGWYTFTYSFVDSTSTYTNSTVTTTFVVDGVVRNEVYAKLRDIPYSSSWELFNHDYKEWYDILYPLYYKGMLDGMLSEISDARKNEILDMMKTLKKLLNQKTS